MKNKNKKETKYLPVPQQYFSTGSYDQITIREIYFRKDRNKFSRRLRYYFPLTDKWLEKDKIERELKNFCLSFVEWECIWVLGLSTSKIGSLEWAERKTEVVYKNKSYVTKIFIKTLLLKDPYNPSIDYDDFVSRFDLINDYFESRKENEFKVDYDFSRVPDIFRKTDKIQLTYYFDGIKKLYTATYRTLNTELKDAIDFRPIIVSYANRDKRAKKFIENAKKLHGNKYNYDYVEYKNNNTPVKIICNTCGTIFYQAPVSHLVGKEGCPNCLKNRKSENRRMPLNEFIKRSEEIHGEGTYDYSEVNYINKDTPVKIVCNKHGSFFQRPRVHLRGCGCPNCSPKSTGEDYVEEYLKLNNIIYVSHERVLNGEKLMIPDFIFSFNNNNYWIEYNGEQHYEFIPFFHVNITNFKNQLIRDLIKRKYCEMNNINLIEIPYIYDSFDLVSEFLNNILINKTKPTKLVNYSVLYKLDNTGLNLEELCIPCD